MGLALPASAQLADYWSDPEDGGEFRGSFQLAFFEPMQDTIALRFEGTGGVEFDRAWMTLGGTIPNQVLECAPQGALPPGATVTWTINPEGTGFTTQGGRVLPTSSGTFIVPAETSVITMQPFPRDGHGYDPEIDGPVTFTFSEAMDTSVDPNEVVDLSPGTWSWDWADDRTLAGTIQPPVAATYYAYFIAGLRTAFGVDAPEFQGGFEIQSGEFLTFTLWEEGLPQSPLRLVFSAEMDQSIDLAQAVSIAPGVWAYAWVNAITLECTPIGALETGTYTLMLDVEVLRSLSGATLAPWAGFGFFSVHLGSGTPAPDCPAELTALPFPKTLSLCGPGLSAWDSASVYSDAAGTGWVLAGWSEDGLESLARMDADGRVMATVMTLDPGTELITGPDPARFLAARLTDDFAQLELGLYQFSQDRTPIFERALQIEDADVSTQYLTDGRIAVVQDLNTQVEVVMLNADGSVAWAKRYASPLFGSEGGGGWGWGSGQFVSFGEMPSGYLLEVVHREWGEDGAATANILVRLNQDGSLASPYPAWR